MLLIWNGFLFISQLFIYRLLLESCCVLLINLLCYRQYFKSSQKATEIEGFNMKAELASSLFECCILRILIFLDQCISLDAYTIYPKSRNIFYLINVIIFMQIFISIFLEIQFSQNFVKYLKLFESNQFKIIIINNNFN